MSTSKGSNNRTRPQKHQNRTAFKNDLHDTSNKTKQINSLDIFAVCKRCKEIIEWKIKYKKYKPLTVPKKCVSCDQKVIKHAYHVMCLGCAKNKKACAKCCKTTEVINKLENENSTNEFNTIIKSLPERKRRTLLRYIKKAENQDIKLDDNEIASKLTNLKINLNDISSEDNDDSDGTNYGTDDD